MPDFQNKPEHISFKDEESEKGLKNVMRRSKEDSVPSPPLQAQWPKGLKEKKMAII